MYVNSSCLGIKTDFTVKQLYTIFIVNINSICLCKITNFTVKSQYSISTVNIYSKISCKNTEIFNSVTSSQTITFKLALQFDTDYEEFKQSVEALKEQLQLFVDSWFEKSLSVSPVI